MAPPARHFCPIGRLAWAASLWLAAGVSLAQGTAPTAVPQGSPARADVPALPRLLDPLNPQAQVPAVIYTSPLATYRRLGEDKRVPWTQANETVNRIGGWRSYAREAQQPDTMAPGPVPQAGAAPGTVTAPGAAASAVPSPAPGHRGHGLR